MMRSETSKFFFYLVEEECVALAHHLPMDFAGDCFLASDKGFSCNLVVEQSTSSAAPNHLSPNTNQYHMETQTGNIEFPENLTILGNLALAVWIALDSLALMLINLGAGVTFLFVALIAVYGALKFLGACDHATTARNAPSDWATCRIVLWQTKPQRLQTYLPPAHCHILLRTDRTVPSGHCADVHNSSVHYPQSCDFRYPFSADGLQRVNMANNSTKIVKNQREMATQN
jgi:hypothetical protein